MNVVTPIKSDIRKHPRRDRTRKEFLRDSTLKVEFRYSGYTHSGLKEYYPATEIISYPCIEHERYGLIRTRPDYYIHIAGKVHGRQRWWARWAEFSGWLC